MSILLQTSNQMIVEEQMYDVNVLAEEALNLEKGLNEDQRSVYEAITQISQGSELALLVQKAKLIIWDKAPMIHRHAFEAFDRKFREIMQTTNHATKDLVFGGKTVVLGDLGDGKLPAISKEGDDEPTWIEMPKDILVETEMDNKTSIVHEIYPNLLHRYKDLQYLTEREILTPKNKVVDEINNYIRSLIPGDVQVYKSADRICPFSNTSTNDDALYPT
ncbi:uncharacterized protein LOC110685718 [Chenopodium quinoa]|uniref:uncharacterized protein LOC110685718 n=1 Tax=Chenopodium quinoa TaxID=63459 RepID=UPI000B7783D5|nr:uncharacterized protein LOC110685718 [Chenopodium quinoa]